MLALFRSLAAEPGAVFLDSSLPRPGARSYLGAWPAAVHVARRRGEPLLPPALAGLAPGEARRPARALPRWIGFLAYEAASGLDRDLATREPEPGLPLAHWARYDALITLDHESGKLWVEGDGPAARRLERMVREARRRARQPHR